MLPALVTLLVSSPALAVTIPCDGVVSGRISSPSAIQTIDFTVSDREIVQVTVVDDGSRGPNFGAVWSLTDALGNPASSCGDSSYWYGQVRDCGPLAAGSYRIVVQDWGQDDVGGFLAHLQRLTAPAACETTGLGCDGVAAGRIDSRAESDLLRFTVADREIVQVTVVGDGVRGPRFGATWRLLDASGNPASSCGDSSYWYGIARDCGPLSAGTYQVQIEDWGREDEGGYLAHLQRLTAANACETTSIGCDGAPAGRIDSRVETDLLRFNVTDREIVQVTVVDDGTRGPAFGAVWRLLDASGNPAPSCGDSSYWHGIARDCGPLPAGTYQIQIEDWGREDGGGYLPHLQRLTASVACETTAIACDGAPTGRIDSRVETDLLRFSVGSQEIVHVTVVDDGTRGPRFGATWRLLDAQGSPAPSCGDSSYWYGIARDCGPLPGGTYQIEIEDWGREDGGGYLAHLQRLTASAACETTSVCGTASARIEPRVETDLLRFALNATGSVHIKINDSGLRGPAFGSVWRLVDATGNPAASCGDSSYWGGAERDCGLLSAGTYQVLVEDWGREDMGGYDLSVVGAALASCPSCGNGRVDGSEQCDLGSGSNGTQGSCCSSTCRFEPSTKECRGAAGTCDVAEFCGGTSTTCPTDQFRPSTTTCRAAADVCDIAETCSGTSAQCPSDRKSTGVCRAANGVCDVAESCDGVANDCPADRVQPTTTVCRVSAGVCDVAETCDGTSKSCPADRFEPSTKVCRPSRCAPDPSESCTGSSSACPVDGVGECPDGSGLMCPGTATVGQTFLVEAKVDVGTRALGAWRGDLTWNPESVVQHQAPVRGGTTPEFSSNPSCNPLGTNGQRCNAFQTANQSGPTNQVSLARYTFLARGPAGSKVRFDFTPTNLVDPISVRLPLPAASSCEVELVDTRCGDVNGDQVADVGDALLIARYDVGQLACGVAPFSHPRNCNVTAPPAADADCDIGDALRVANFDIGRVAPADFMCTPWACPGRQAGVPAAEASSSDDANGAIAAGSAAEMADAAAAASAELAAERAAQAALLMELVVPARGINPGALFNVDLRIRAGTTPIGAYSAVISCDPSLLEPVASGIRGGRTAEFAEKPNVNVDAAACRIRLNSFQVANENGPTGNVNVARLQFRLKTGATPAAMTSIRIEEAKLYDPEGVTVPVELKDGKVSVACTQDAQCDGDSSCTHACNAKGLCEAGVATDVDACRQRLIPGTSPSEGLDCEAEWFVAGATNGRARQSCTDNDARCDADPAVGVCRFRVAACLNASGDARVKDPVTGAVCISPGVGQMTVDRPVLGSTNPLVDANARALLAALVRLGGTVGAAAETSTVAWSPAKADAYACTGLVGFSVAIPAGATSAQSPIAVGTVGVGASGTPLPDADRLTLVCRSAS